MAFKALTIRDSLEWVRIHGDVFGDSPTTFGKPDDWLIRAGQLCRDMIVNVKPSLKRAITDSDVRKSLNVESEPDGATL